jgi:hypothetical protein
MISILQRGVRRISREAHYGSRIASNRVKRMFHGPVENKYLFILSPPFCGSTLLNELISTSTNVSTNNMLYTREGQRLPGVMEVMYENWDENAELDWAYIKRKWRLHWDVTKPVLLEKSPPNIIRAKIFERHFAPAYFIVSNRDPYAFCESLMRNSPQNRVPEVAARFAIRCLKHQKSNIEELGNVLSISYEELTNDPSIVKEKIVAFLPELAGIDTSRTFTAHNHLSMKMKITNLNDAKIKKLGRETLNRINSVFYEHADVLAHFNYEIIEEIPA